MTPTLVDRGCNAQNDHHSKPGTFANKCCQLHSITSKVSKWIRRSGNHSGPVGYLIYLKSTPPHLFSEIECSSWNREWKKELPFLHLKPRWPGFCQAAWTLLAGFRRSCIDLYGKPLVSANSMRIKREHSQTTCRIYDIE